MKKVLQTRLGRGLSLSLICGLMFAAGAERASADTTVDTFLGNNAGSDGFAAGLSLTSAQQDALSIGPVNVTSQGAGTIVGAGAAFDGEAAAGSDVTQVTDNAGDLTVTQTLVGTDATAFGLAGGGSLVTANQSSATLGFDGLGSVGEAGTDASIVSASGAAIFGAADTGFGVTQLAVTPDSGGVQATDGGSFSVALGNAGAGTLITADQAQLADPSGSVQAQTGNLTSGAVSIGGGVAATNAVLSQGQANF